MTRQYSSDPPLSQGNNSSSVTVGSLLPGDIIISTTPSSGLIRRITEDEVSHAMLYIGNGEVVESIPGEGVRRVWLQEALDGASVAVAFRHPKINYELAETIVNVALEYERNETGYDYAGAVSAGLRDNLRLALSGTSTPSYNSVSRLYCSELIVDVFSKANLDLVGYLSNYSLPGDFACIAEYGEIDYVGHIIACEGHEDDPCDGVEYDLSVHQNYVYTAGDQTRSENDNANSFLNSEEITYSTDSCHPDHEVHPQNEENIHISQEVNLDPFLDSDKNTCSADYYHPDQEVFYQSQMNTHEDQENSQEEAFDNGDDGETPFN